MIIHYSVIDTFINDIIVTIIKSYMSKIELWVSINNHDQRVYLFLAFHR